jgi:hypothetical protein
MPIPTDAHAPARSVQIIPQTELRARLVTLRLTQEQYGKLNTRQPITTYAHALARSAREPIPFHAGFR